MKLIRFILALIVVVLAVIVVISEGFNKVMIMPYMLMGLGILNIFNAVYLYKENKKTDAIMMLLIGSFVTIAVILSYIMN